MTCKLMAGDAVLYEQEYYSVGGGFIEWKGYKPPKKGQPKYPYSTMKELREHAEKNKLSIAQVVMANEVAVSGKSEAEINAFIDKIARRDGRHRQGGSVGAGERRCPVRSSCKTKAGDVYKRAHGRQVRERARRRRRRPPTPWRARKRTRAAISSSPRRPADRRA